MRNRERDEAASNAALAEMDGALIRASEGLVEAGTRAQLYHYTSSEGFRGIIEGNNLRFADPLFLNDGSEVHYANDVLHGALSNLDGLTRREEEFARRVVERIQNTAIQFRPIIFCLSEEPDLLNQWRDYGKDVVAYCIEFETISLLTYDWGFPCQIVKINYDRDSQQLIVQKLLNETAGIFRKYRSSLFNRDFASKVLDAALAEIWGALISFKNPAFAAEREWRLLAYSSSFGRQRAKFRSGPLGVVPYFERVPRAGLSLPINRVWVGPSPFSAVARHATGLFLSANGYDGEVIASQIPAR